MNLIFTVRTTPPLLMELLLCVFYTGVFIYLLLKLKFFSLEGLPKYALPVAFIFKIICGTILYLIYTYHYGGRNTSDTFRFFDDAGIMYGALKEHPADYFRMLTGIGSGMDHLQHYYNEMNNWQKSIDYNLYNDNRTIIRFNAFIHLFSFGYYHVHTIFFCFLSLTGLTAIYKGIVQFFQDRRTALFLGVFFIPSVIFWSSGVLKEGILLFAFGFFVMYFFKVLNTGLKLKYLLWLFVSAFLLMLSKFYVLIAILPGVAFLLFIKLTGEKKLAIKFGGMHLAFFLLFVNMHLFLPRYDLMYILSKKQEDFRNVAKMWNANSVIDLEPLKPTLESLLKLAPTGFLNTLFVPSVLDKNISSPLILLAALENLAVIVVLLAAVYFFKKPPSTHHPFLYFCISFVMILAILIGITTPIGGAIVRYKIPLLPFLWAICLLITDREKVLSKIPFIKNS